jgi:hypothetical protein
MLNAYKYSILRTVMPYMNAVIFYADNDNDDMNIF